MTATSPTVLVVPGWTNSGPRHWQSLWQQRHPAWVRVQQRDWDLPDPASWIAALDDAVRGANGPVVLVAHSLGSLLVPLWSAETGGAGVAGAWLVAPADVTAPDTPAELRCFAPVPSRRLPFPSVVVASRSDPFVSWDRARRFASWWGSRLVDAGDAGHINTDAGYGEWPDGERLLLDFVAECEERLRLAAALVQRLPDVPRWVEARASLLVQRCELFGVRDDEPSSFVVRDPATHLVTVVGAPESSAVRDAALRGGADAAVLVSPGDASLVAQALPGWKASRAVLHVLPSAGFDRDVMGDVALLDPAELKLIDLPGDLRHELQIGAVHSPIAAAFEDGRPVSFCYAGAITETLWDVAIDTLEAYRRRGCAERCATLLIRTMLERGRRPVWGALEENTASWKLARKLGFVEADELVLFEADAADGRTSPAAEETRT